MMFSRQRSFFRLGGLATAAAATAALLVPAVASADRAPSSFCKALPALLNEQGQPAGDASVKGRCDVRMTQWYEQLRDAGPITRGMTSQSIRDVLGSPSKITRRTSKRCEATWKRAGVQAVFTKRSNKPKLRGNSCNSAQMVLRELVLTGGHWQLEEGLAIGDTLQRLQALAPDLAIPSPEPGKPHDITVIGHVSFGNTFPVVVARASGNKITAFHVLVSADLRG